MKIKHFVSILSILTLFSCTNDAEELLDTVVSKSTESAGVVYGVVFDSATEMPVAGATVSVYPSGKRIITGSDGQYEFYDLPDNNYVIQVTHADYVSTVDAVKLRGGVRFKSDVRITRGQNSLVVDEHQINIANVDSYHSLLISNISNKPIRWNISYDDIVDPATGSVYVYLTEWEGELQPYETKEIFISLTVSSTLNNNFAFPLILQSGLEKIGIVLVPYGDGGKIYSKIVGKWTLYRTGHYEDGIQIRQSVPFGASILTIKDNLEYEIFNNNVSFLFDPDDPDSIDLGELWHISYSSGTYTYIPDQNILYFGNTFAEGFAMKVLSATDYELTLASLDFDQDACEGEIYFYTK